MVVRTSVGRSQTGKAENRAPIQSRLNGACVGRRFKIKHNDKRNFTTGDKFHE